jgi:cleavage stimulation factor subunit 1
LIELMATAAPGNRPAWLPESVVPSLAGVREARGAAATAADGTTTRKRMRAPVAVEPANRRLHQLIAAQLHHEGYSDAAAAVMRSTGCLAPMISESATGQRLASLVRLGELSERLRPPHPTAGAGASMGSAERALFGGSIFAAPAPPESYAYGEVYSSLPLDCPLRSVGYSGGGEYIACGATNGCVRIFSSATIAQRNARVGGAERAAPSQHGVARTIKNVHEQSVEWVGFHPTAGLLVTAGRDGRLCLVDYTEPQCRAPLEQMGPNAPARKAATTEGAKPSDAFACYTDTYPIRSVALHPGGEYAALATDHSLLRLLNIETGVLLSPSESHGAAVADVGIDGEGRLIATASYDGTWRVMDMRSGATVYQPAANTPGTAGLAAASIPTAHSGVAVTSCALSRAGRVLLTSGADGLTKMWDLRRSSTEIIAIGEAAKTDVRMRSRFSFDEAAIVTDASQRKATSIVDVFSGIVVASLQHAQVQRSFACSPVAQVIATGGDDYRLRLWSPAAVTLIPPEDAA